MDVECLFNIITATYKLCYILSGERHWALHVILPVRVGHYGHLDQGVRLVGSHLPPPQSNRTSTVDHGAGVRLALGVELQSVGSVPLTGTASWSRCSLWWA